MMYDRMPTQEVETPTRQEPFNNRSTAPPFSEFQSRLRAVANDCIQRLVLIEDLTPDLIDLLGATFDVPPHVFEEHLDRSGYRKASEQRRDAKAWQTLSSAQGYSSVMWYRPALPLIPMTPRFRTKIIKDTKPEVQCPFDECPIANHYLPLAATANIWRHQLDLCPEPGVYHKGSETEYPVGWEEKATIWKRDIDGCEFGEFRFRTSIPISADFVSDCHRGSTPCCHCQRRKGCRLTTRTATATCHNGQPMDQERRRVDY